jgi:hypothetical protein
LLLEQVPVVDKDFNDRPTIPEVVVAAADLVE